MKSKAWIQIAILALPLTAWSAEQWEVHVASFTSKQQHEAPFEEVHFDRVVAPVLAGRCIDCHSGSEPKGELDLTRKTQALEHVVAGDPGKSPLWEMVDTDEMPPKHPLPENEKEILRGWIASGAKWGDDPIDPFRYSSAGRAGYDWWSLQPLETAGPPLAERAIPSEIDRFVLATLAEKGLRPAPRADPRTLVRRLYFDLLGLPAPVEEIERFAENPSQRQWELLVDELLASDHYGERWARHWMDIARFGESGGFEYNTPRESAWHYRDWLIRAFNDDMPYDQFVRMQLAGDILKPDTVEGAAAVGFLVAGVHNEVLGKSAQMRMAGRQDELEEIAGTVGQALLGMTVHCARCHDHKFDPISAREYYQFVAALDGVNHGTRKLNYDRGSVEERRGLEQRRAELDRRLVDLVSARDGQLGTNANLIELNRAIPANREGASYRVSLKLAPTVWAGPRQATREHDGVVVRIVGTDRRVIASQFLKSRPWDRGENANAFEAHAFGYEGDGSGPVRVEIQPYPLSSERFGGAVDDLVLSGGGKTIFEDDFDQLEQTHPPGTQATTQRKVYHSAKSKRWSHRGLNAIHAVEHADGNLALQLFGGRKTRTKAKPESPAEKKLAAEIAQIDREIAAVKSRAFTEVFTVRPGRTGVMRVHHRGSVSSLGDGVAAGGLGAIRGLSPDFAVAPGAPDAQRRRKLAEWIASPDNALFHRVAVNRIWHHHFGQGLVTSPNDFGFNGGQPSHPELLDWLAVRFRDGGYSLKQLHRLILTSSTWQQSSQAANQTAREIDADNRLLWRQNPRRVDAEMFRDSVLAISGALNPQMYGPGFKDVRVDRVPPANYYVAIDPVGPEFNRRTVYRWHVRGQRSALLDTFDCPDPSVTTPARSRTTTPSQALSQWNHPFVLRMSDRLAERIAAEVGEKLDDQVAHAWRLVLAREPQGQELADARALVRLHGLALLARTLFNSNELIWID